MNIRKPIATNHGDWMAKFGETWKSQAQKLKEKLGDVIEEIRMPVEYATDVPIVYVKPASIATVLRFMRDEPGFEYGFLTDITATDEYPAEPRFEVVYNLFSTTKFWRIRIKVRVAEGAEVPTATSVWPSANWVEREVWDMFGVRFSGHPDLRRILMDERWQGHPLRKDYPIRGYQVFTDAEPIRQDLLE